VGDVPLARLHVLVPRVGAQLHLLDTVAGELAIVVDVGVALGVVELDELGQGVRVVRVGGQDLLLGRDLIGERIRAARAPAATEEIAETARAGAHPEKDEADRKDRREGTECDPDYAAAAGTLQVEKHGGRVDEPGRRPRPDRWAAGPTPRYRCPGPVPARVRRAARAAGSPRRG